MERNVALTHRLFGNTHRLFGKELNEVPLIHEWNGYSLVVICPTYFFQEYAHLMIFVVCKAMCWRETTIYNERWMYSQQLQISILVFILVIQLIHFHNFVLKSFCEFWYNLFEIVTLYLLMVIDFLKQVLFHQRILISKCARK